MGLISWIICILVVLLQGDASFRNGILGDLLSDPRSAGGDGLGRSWRNPLPRWSRPWSRYRLVCWSTSSPRTSNRQRKRRYPSRSSCHLSEEDGAAGAQRGGGNKRNCRNRARPWYPNT